MNDKDCTCPLCNGTFAPDNGMTAAEHIARGIITTYATLQAESENNDRICPRCGFKSLLPGVLRNALSRHYDIYICPECGNDEAMRVFKNNVLPASEWWIVKEIYALKDYDSDKS